MTELDSSVAPDFETTVHFMRACVYYWQGNSVYHIHLSKALNRQKFIKAALIAPCLWSLPPIETPPDRISEATVNNMSIDPKTKLSELRKMLEQPLSEEAKEKALERLVRSVMQSVNAEGYSFTYEECLESAIRVLKIKTTNSAK